jgi:hypothetical protein
MVAVPCGDEEILLFLQIFKVRREYRKLKHLIKIFFRGRVPFGLKRFVLGKFKFFSRYFRILKKPPRKW